MRSTVSAAADRSSCPGASLVEEGPAVSRWTREDVLQAAAEWVWVPDDAQEVHTEDYQLIGYPEFYELPTQVPWSRTSRPVDEIVAEVLAHARGWGRAMVYWWVSAATRPPQTESVLLARGASLAETVTVLARELAPGGPDLGVPQDITATAVRDEAALRDMYRVESEVWESPVPDAAQVARGLADVMQDWATGAGFRVVAYLDGEPVSAGGCTLAGDVARLWGAGTRAAWRGRGAYRAVLAERLRIAAGLGATLALVKGRVTTSAPILKRAGFVAYGEERCYGLDVDELFRDGRQSGGHRRGRSSPR